MALFAFFNLTLNILLKICLVVALGCACYYKWSFRYWKSRNVPCAKARIPLGSFDYVKLNIGMHMKMVYDQLRKQRVTHGGGIYVFAQPRYMPINPLIIKHIVQNNFDSFTDRGFYHNRDNDPLSENMALIKGPKWYPIRTKLSAAFTPFQLKKMFKTFLMVAHEMETALNKACQQQTPIDLKEISDCYTIDSVGSSAFGIECNSFKYPDTEFRKQGKLVFERVGSFRGVKNVFAFIYPKLSKYLGIRLFKKNTAEFFSNVVKETVTLRKNNDYARQDLMQLIIEADKHSEQKLTIREITANAFAFFIGGYETSSSTITFCLFELAKQLDIQQKARDEIQTAFAKCKGEITYEALMNLPYFNQIYEETLRKYPAISYVTRECVKEYKVPGTETVIEQGMHIMISLLGLHYDPEYFPDPDRFDPDRFSPENKRKIRPFTYMPFGEGPRNCIGLRYAVVMTRVALAIFIKNYKFSLNERTNTSIRFDPRTFTLIPRYSILLDITKV